MKHPFASIILVAGQGTRMRSRLPKVMHKLAGKPLILHALAAIQPLKPEKTVVVTAPGMDIVRKTVGKGLFAVQDKQLGTGHAVRCGMKKLPGYQGTVLVLYGDTPLVRPESLKKLLTERARLKCAIALLGMRPDDPTGYGRLVMPEEFYVNRIVECKDATPKEKKIPWVWGGVMAFDGEFLARALKQLKPSAVTKEFYLTALVAMATAENKRTLMVPMEVEEAMGINDRKQLAEAERVLQQRLRKQAMEQGTTLVDPDSVYLSNDTKLGQDVVVHPHVVFGAGVVVEDGAEIRSFSHIDGAHVGKNAVVGPFARLRPGAVIGEEAHVGNFVEVKKSTLGKGAKANHLSYIGDSEVGANANIGAGTITCNYDGKNKYKTVIGKNAFIGSNTALVAPVKVGDNAVIGAGSVITEDVEGGALAIARGRQVNKVKKLKARK